MGRMPKKKLKRQSDKALLAQVKKEMAQPRSAESTRRDAVHEGTSPLVPRSTKEKGGWRRHATRDELGCRIPCEFFKRAALDFGSLRQPSFTLQFEFSPGALHADLALGVLI
jgi:hypothetical protein